MSATLPPVFLLLLILQIVSTPCRAGEAIDAVGPYDALYDMIMTRQGQDGKIYGRNEIAPLIYANSNFPFDEESYPKFAAAVDTLAALPQEKIAAYGDVRRALLQHHLWKVFDIAAPEHISLRMEAGARLKISTIRKEARTKIASLMKRLALTNAEIEALPNPGQMTAQSGHFAKQHDPKCQFKPFFPADLFADDSPWVCLGRDNHAIPGYVHAHSVENRSAFLVYMRLPGGRAETRAYLDKLNEGVVFPAGTQFALVDRALLISDEGKLTLSPLVLNVQLRAHVIVDFNRKDGWPKDPTQCFAEFATQPRNLMRRDGVMRALGPEEGRFKSLCRSGDPFQCGNGPFVQLRLKSCVSCHRQPGLGSLRSYIPSMKVEEGIPAKIAQATAERKRNDRTFKTLLAHWQSEGETGAIRANAAAKSAGMDHPDPTHLWTRLHRHSFIRKGPDGREYGLVELAPSVYRSTKHRLVRLRAAD